MGQQQMEWANRVPSLIQGLSAVYENSDSMEISLKCSDDREVKIHRFMSAILCKNLIDLEDNGVIDVPESFQYPIVRALVSLLYQGEMELNEPLDDSDHEVLEECADFLGVRGFSLEPKTTQMVRITKRPTSFVEETSNKNGDNDTEGEDDMFSPAAMLEVSMTTNTEEEEEEDKAKRTPYSCSECHKTFEDRTSLDQHCKVSHPHLWSDRMSRAFLCAYCTDGFDGAEELAEHMDTHADLEFEDLEEEDELDGLNDDPHDLAEGVGVLGVLGDTFSMAQTATAAGQKKPFKCTACGTEFSWKAGYRRHMRTFHPELIGTESYAQLAKVTTEAEERQKALKREIAASKPYNCEMCGTRFGWKGGWRRHMKNFHGELVRANPSLFYDQNSSVLNEGNKTSASEKPFSCEECGTKFGWRGAWRRHVRNFHPELVASGKIKLHDVDPSSAARKAPASNLVALGSLTKPLPLTSLSDVPSLPLPKLPQMPLPKLPTAPIKVSNPDLPLHLLGAPTSSGNRLRPNEKPFYCDHCSTRFTYRAGWRRHMKNFHADLVADGTVDIDAPTKGAVSNNMSLLSNMTSPAMTLTKAISPADPAMKPFKCNVCDVKFAYKAGWRRHVKNFHGDLLASGAINLSTGNPGLAARLKGSMPAAPVPVPGGISINCTKCNEVFGDIESLQRHVLESHSPSNGGGSDDLEFEDLEVEDEEDDVFEDDGEDGEPLTNFLSVEMMDGDSGMKRRMSAEANHESGNKRFKVDEDDDDDMVQEIMGDESEGDE